MMIDQQLLNLIDRRHENIAVKMNAPLFKHQISISQAEKIGVSQQTAHESGPGFDVANIVL